MWKLLTFPWRAYQRFIDVQILWPEIVKGAPSTDHAQNAMLFHAMRDRTWTTDYTYDEIVEYIRKLHV